MLNEYVLIVAITLGPRVDGATHGPSAESACRSLLASMTSLAQESSHSPNISATAMRCEPRESSDARSDG